MVKIVKVRTHEVDDDVRALAAHAQATRYERVLAPDVHTTIPAENPHNAHASIF